ncbi:apolipoprotein(a)-like [Anneissia japonica]|uniref:apolipoprotein(a)-like n=1 Tax=Anneissia japonica TaxID=1529436 RepID=UPI0014259E0F|nr:apolipoprotein(a)-like [Anneissia japonica]
MPNAYDYRGSVHTTTSGFTCQDWASQTPHSHSYTPESYPDDGLLNNNNCRNPDQDDTAWCYTTDPNRRWEFCDVGSPSESCEELSTTPHSTQETTTTQVSTTVSTSPECYEMANAYDYRGSVHTTTSGFTCQDWASQTPHSHSYTPESYPNDGLLNNNNCRNPDQDNTAWCYTTDPNRRWEFCDVGSQSESCEQETTITEVTSTASSTTLSTTQITETTETVVTTMRTTEATTTVRTTSIESTTQPIICQDDLGMEDDLIVTKFNSNRQEVGNVWYVDTDSLLNDYINVYFNKPTKVTALTLRSSPEGAEISEIRFKLEKKIHGMTNFEVIFETEIISGERLEEDGPLVELPADEDDYISELKITYLNSAAENADVQLIVKIYGCFEDTSSFEPPTVPPTTVVITTVSTEITTVPTTTSEPTTHESTTITHSSHETSTGSVTTTATTRVTEVTTPSECFEELSAVGDLVTLTSGDEIVDSWLIAPDNSALTVVFSNPITLTGIRIETPFAIRFTISVQYENTNVLVNEGRLLVEPDANIAYPVIERPVVKVILTADDMQTITARPVFYGCTEEVSTPTIETTTVTETTTTTTPSIHTETPTTVTSTTMVVTTETPSSRVTHTTTETVTTIVPECYEMPNAYDYRGSVHTTTSGFTCQDWASQTPHSHSYTPESYPDDGLLNNNNCRNPDQDNTAWCYTTDPNRRWEFCDVGSPSESCEISTTTSVPTTETPPPGTTTPPPMLAVQVKVAIHVISL